MRKIIIKDSENPVYLNESQISSIEVNTVIEKMDCGDDGRQEVEFIEVTVVMSNGDRFVDNELYESIEIVEKEYGLSVK